MVLSTVEANKIAKSAISLLKISIGYNLSKSLVNIIEKILKRNGIKPQTGGRKYMIKRYVGGQKPEEVKILETTAINLLKVALVYDLSKSVLDELKKILENNKQ
jgi:hypothetical protein